MYKTAWFPLAKDQHVWLTLSKSATVHTTFQHFSAKCTSLYKTEVFIARISTFGQFSHWAHVTFQRFSAKFTSLYKTAFSDPRSATFCHFCTGHHFLAIFSKVQEFVQNSVFSPRSARFVIFALGTPLFSEVFSKVHEFVQNSVFSPRLARFVIFALGAALFSSFLAKCTSLYKNSVFSPRLARFVIFALRAPLFSHFQQSASVCTKQRFQPEISTFCHFRTGQHHFLAISAKCTSLSKEQNRRFQPEISTFYHFCTGHTTFQRFSIKCTSLYKTAFSARNQARFVILH